MMFFQRYIYAKSYVLMDLEFMALDTFDAVRPKFMRFQSQAEAEAVCRQVEEREAEGGDAADVIRAYREEEQYYREADDYYDEEEEEAQASAEESSEAALREEIQAQRQELVSAQEALEIKAFEQELRALVQESAAAARREPQLGQQRREILVPQVKKPPSAQGGMAFALITRKGNKPAVKQIAVPLDSQLARKTQERLRAEECERAQVKEQILKLTSEAPADDEC